MSLVPGAVVGANVRLVRPLKRGGMGSVWLAEHLTLRAPVAVKFMSEVLAKDAEYVARFSREAMASATIRSPHVAQVFDHGVAQNGTPFIVMELLEGEDLRTRLGRLGALAVEEVALVVAQVARALSKAHALSIVHRDIKPDNIFFTDQDGEPFVKVLDFGIAKHAAQESELGVTSTGAMVGTPHYMSPEQVLSARSADHRSDLWSLGVVAYRSLVGRLPFQGETLGAVCIAIERATFVVPSERRPELPVTLDAWFRRALARDPAARFQSAKEMAEAFAHAVRAAGYASVPAPFRMEPSSPGVPTSPSGMLHAPLPSAMYASGGTPAPVDALGSYPSHRALGEPRWPSSGPSSAPQPPQTFHGSSVTRADGKSTSRRAKVTMISAALGACFIVGIALALIVGRGPASALGESSAMPQASSALAAAPPLPSSASLTSPSLEPGSPAAPATSASARRPPSQTTSKSAPATTTKSVSSGRPKRDRGF